MHTDHLRKIKFTVVSFPFLCQSNSKMDLGPSSINDTDPEPVFALDVNEVELQINVESNVSSQSEVQPTILFSLIFWHLRFYLSAVKFISS